MRGPRSDRADAAIGAGTLLGLILLGLAGTMALLHRRHDAGRPIATAG